MKNKSSIIISTLAAICLVCSFLSCNMLGSKDKQKAYSTVITKATQFSDTLKDGKIRVVTVTPSSYTPSVYVKEKFDTVVYLPGVTPPPPPVDTVPPPPPPVPTGYTLLYSNGYNTSSDINSNQLGRGSISTSVFKSGTGSFKSVVNAGDGQISGGYRSEQQYGDNLSPNGAEIAVEYDELFEALPNVAGLSVQWHGNTSGTSGQMSMWIQGGQFMVQRNTTGTAGSPNIYQQGTLKSIQTNTWYHLRWEIKFSSGSDGYVRVYIDNTLYYSVTGKTSDGSGQYLKVGQNLFASPGKNSILYIDNLNVWKK
jgi:hypothetical protein